MTVVPLPDVPCVRVRLIWNESTLGEAGCRLYFSYTGSAPTGANCTTLAGDVASAYASDLASLVDQYTILQEVDVLDIATDSGLSGQWNGTHAGTDTGPTIPSSLATNIEFNISRRYRGGKPRMFLPPPSQDSVTDQTHWTTGHVSAANTGIAAFAAAIEALSIGSMGTLQHVNLSYYKGFTNIVNSSGRERAVPTYRTTALHDNIVGYSTKAIVGSQRRRRTSTTP